MKHEVVNLQNKKVGDIELPDSIFQQPIRVDILSRVVEWQLAKRRSGNHKTKEIAEISGTTKKMYRQKGTGGARHGSKRAPQFRGGSVIFGPVVRSHAYSLPKKVRQLGLKSVLSSKLQSGDLIFVDSFEINKPKTKDLKEILTKFGTENVLLIDVDTTRLTNTALAAGNVIGFDVLPQIGANVYDIMRKEKIILTVDAVKALEARLK
ncbi:MAG: 50S ribosomal protein L4 [Alphaproteobacteria bacterium]|jgi:large subunit ribosomal protein L4|nr:50S ribosomal protein L4 [Alphaproteobacteria bacterium]